MADLPRALNTDQAFYVFQSEQLGRIADAMVEQNELLRQVLTARQAGRPDQTEAPAEPGVSVAVELREPDPPGKASGKVLAPAEAEPASTPTSPEIEAAPADEKKPTRTARGGRRSTKASA